MINLTLREEAKHGFFGKIAAGAGPGSIGNSTADISSFSKERKLTLYGLANNAAGPDISGLTGNAGEQQGISTLAGAGAHYDNRFLEDGRLSLTADYGFNTGTTQVTTQSIVQKKVQYPITRLTEQRIRKAETQAMISA